MALIKRVSRLFAADLHAVIDQLEEPDILLKQAIREMDEEIAKQEQRHKIFCRELGQLGKRREETDRSLADLDERLDLCFSNDNEELARQVVRRKVEAARVRRLLTEKQDSLKQKVAELETCIEANRDRLEGMRQKAELLADGPHVRGGDGHLAGDGPRIDETEVELAFLREKQARSKT